ncbi:MAG: hypothetical protein LBF87_06580 [Treponema sp.]|nr:hypothetical protein [Treponema sp.]
MKRFFSMAALLALGVFLVFAGGGQQSSGGQQGGAVQPPNKVITINTWADVGAEEGWKCAAEGYMKLHPDVSIVIDLKSSERYGEWLHNILPLSIPNTPKLGSRLNIAEIGPSAMSSQCHERRIDTLEKLKSGLEAWQHDRNRNQKMMKWQFTAKDACMKLHSLYPAI